jgi:hypothetical protein
MSLRERERINDVLFSCMVIIPYQILESTKSMLEFCFGPGKQKERKKPRLSGASLY